MLPLTLNERRIDLWCVFPDQITDPALWDAYRGLLSPEESQREQRFTHDEPRRQFLAGRALLRTALAQYTGVDPRRLEFQCNRHGKPTLSKKNDTNNNSRGLTAPGGETNNPHMFRGLLAPGYFDSCGADLPLEFSLSHTRGLVVCAVALHDAVGVDVECDRANLAPMDLAHCFFAPAETERLAELPPDQQRAAFFELWTLKEAFVKARGVGLAMPLADFSFLLSDDGSATISFAQPGEERPDQWQFTRLRLGSRYQAAVAIRRPASECSTVVIRETVPLQVQMIGYAIDPALHQDLGNRQDGHPPARNKL